MENCTIDFSLKGNRYHVEFPREKSYLFYGALSLKNLHTFLHNVKERGGTFSPSCANTTDPDVFTEIKNHIKRHLHLKQQVKKYELNFLN
jgi:hypothetical protein